MPLAVRWLVVAGSAALILAAPLPAGITAQSWHLFAIFVATIVGSIVRPVPAGAIVFLGVAAIAVTGTLSPREALSGYADPLVWLVLCAFFMSRAAVLPMMAQKWGRIINTIGGAGKEPDPYMFGSGITNSALLNITKSLSTEFGEDGVHVNAICPGYIETEMNSAFWKTPGGQKLIDRIPQRRIGKPEHLDGALLLLASDAGEFMTGSVITVDGGHTVNTL